MSTSLRLRPIYRLLQLRSCRVFEKSKIYCYSQRFSYSDSDTVTTLSLNFSQE